MHVPENGRGKVGVMEVLVNAVIHGLFMWGEPYEACFLGSLNYLCEFLYIGFI